MDNRVSALGLELIERDESGNITTVITEAPNGGAIKIVVPESKVPYAQRVLNVFLPAGFPASVTDDYVGDANASATAALLLTIIQDSVSRLATILFAYRFGTALEAECKKYRLAADVFNDSAMILDCLSPAFPKPIKILVLCLSGSLRAACGVAGGGSKASLSVHFARTGNVGELNAKDSSQETVIGLLGMVAGSFVVSHITSTWATWMALTLLLAIHLGTNFRAVNCVALRTLNRQRANIVFSALADTGLAMTPTQAANVERIFEHDGVLRWRQQPEILGHAKIGVSFTELIKVLGGGGGAAGYGGPPTTAWGMTSPGSGNLVGIKDIAKIFQKEKHLLWYDTRSRWVTICLKNGITPEEQLKAWVHALLVAKEIRHRETRGNSSKAKTPQRLSKEALLNVLETTLQDLGTSFPGTVERLRAAGWDLGTAVLETMPGYRVGICPLEIVNAGRDKAEMSFGEAKKKI